LPAAPEQASRPADPDAVAAARGAISRTRTGEPAEDPRARADADAHPDDPDADAGGVDTTELLQRELGAQVIEETPNK
ncbi:MAG: DNA polymerase III subunit gamma/tau, partial [Nocardioides sp.]